MAALRIQVLGKGLIPRGGGLAPRKDPFPADLNYISLILNTNGLRVNFVNPETNKLVPLSRTNLRKMWDKYSNFRIDPSKIQDAVKAQQTEESAENDGESAPLEDRTQEENNDVNPTETPDPIADEGITEEEPVSTDSIDGELADEVAEDSEVNIQNEEVTEETVEETVIEEQVADEVAETENTEEVEIEEEKVSMEQEAVNINEIPVTSTSIPAAATHSGLRPVIQQPKNNKNNKSKKNKNN